MRFIMADEGSVYTPSGHDAEVMSRGIYKGNVDIHATTFPPELVWRKKCMKI